MLIKLIVRWLVEILLFFGIFTSKVKYSKGLLFSFFQSLEFAKIDVNLKRYGEIGDGGYWLPNLNSTGGFILSGGVGPTSLFEQELAKTGFQIICFDASVSRLPHEHNNITFEKKYLGNIDDELTISPGKIYEDVMVKVPSSLRANQILKLDIEGSEYGFILGASSNFLSEFRFIIVECHYVDNLFDPLGGKLISEFFKKLLNSHSIYKMERNSAHQVKRKFGFELTRTIELSLIRKNDSLISSSHGNRDLKLRRLFDYN